MTKSHSKLLAHTMRRKGASLTEIADTLKVSKSTAGLWCKDLVMTEAQRLRLRTKQIQAGNAGRMIGAETNRRRKEEKVLNAREEGIRRLATLNEREFLLTGLAIYWGEGSKSDHLSFINSDPAMVLLMIRWFEAFFGVQSDDLVPRIFINEVHRARIRRVTAYWAKTLSIPPSQFRPPTFNKSVPKKLYENHDCHFGLVSLRIRKSTDIKYQIWGLIEGLKNSTLPLPADVAQLVRAPHS